MKHLNHQKGMTAIGWMLVIIMFGLVALLAMKVIPVYLEGYSVGSVVRELGNDAELRSLPAGQIRQRLMKRFSVNMVSTVSADDVYISPTQGGYEVEVDYEVREKVVGNLDIVVAFNFKSDIKKQ